MCEKALATPALSFPAPGPCEGPGGVDIFGDDDSNVAGELFDSKAEGMCGCARSIEVEFNGWFVLFRYMLGFHRYQNDVCGEFVVVGEVIPNVGYF